MSALRFNLSVLVSLACGQVSCQAVPPQPIKHTPQKISPASSDSRALSEYNAGKALKDKGKIKMAIEHFSRAIGYDRRMADAYMQRGYCYVWGEKYNEGIRDYTESINLKPMFQNYRFRAMAYLAIFEHEKAIADLTKAIKLNPKTASMYEYRGDAYQRIEKFNDALKDFSNGLELDPLAEQLRVKRATVLEKLGRCTEAIADYTSLIQRNPDDEDVLMRRARAYQKVEKFQQALADYNLALKADPLDSRAILEGRAQVYEQLGKHQLAKEDRKRAAEISKQNISD